MAINISNNAYKQFISQVKQAKMQGAKELRIPLKQAEDIIIDISLVLMDKIVEIQSNPQNNNSASISFESLSLDGGSFKKEEE